MAGDGLKPMTTDIDSQLSEGDLAVVIGGSGFIGSHLVRALKGIKVKVRVFSRRSYKYCPEKLQTELKHSDWFTGDICDSVALASACKGATAVFYVSGIAHVSSSATEELTRVNVHGARVVAEVCAKTGSRRLVYISSTLASEPASSGYAYSKKKAEDILLDSPELRSSEVHLTILRPTNVYGRGMRGNIAAMIQFIRRGLLPPLPELNNRLTLISVGDTCRAALLAATKSHKTGQIFDLTDGESYTPSLIESAVYKALGRHSPRWSSPRNLFFAAAVLAEVLHYLGIWRNDFGLRTYRNLVADRPIQRPSKIDQLGFVPSQTLYSVMEEILGPAD